MLSSVAHVSFSSSGGAGAVAAVLSEEQRRQGRVSRVHSVISGNLRAKPLSSPVHTVAAAMDHYLVKEPSFGSPISLFRDAVKTPLAHELSSYDIIHLHGINGALDLESLGGRATPKRVVWTLHDMNAFTGTCHYSLGCRNFETSCSECPAVRSAWKTRVENRLAQKIEAIAKIPHLSVVAPSTWLAEQASRSPALAALPLSVIPNPVNPVLTSEPSARERQDDVFRVVVVAQNLEDPVKSVHTAVEAFREVFSTSTKAELILVGRNGDQWASQYVSPTGPLSPGELRDLLHRSDVLLVPSLAENAPLVIAEAAACGVASIVRDVGGMAEMVTTLGVGDSFSDPRELDLLLRAQFQMDSPTRASRRTVIMDKALQAYGVGSVVAAYDKVYGG